MPDQTQVTVQVVGLDVLRKALRKAGQDMADLKDANARAATIVAGAATARAPRRSGRLAGTVRGNRAQRRAVVSAGRAAVPYAGPVHWGWPARGIGAQPFILAAARSTEPVWTALYSTDLNKIIRGVSA